MVFQWVHCVFVIVIPVQLTVGRLCRPEFSWCGHCRRRSFLACWYKNKHSRTCQRRSTDEMQYMPKTAAKNSIHACMLAASALDTSGKSHNIRLKQVAGARSLFWAKHGDNTWCHGTRRAIQLGTPNSHLNGHVHPRITSCIRWSPALFWEAKVRGRCLGHWNGSILLDPVLLGVGSLKHSACKNACEWDSATGISSNH